MRQTYMLEEENEITCSKKHKDEPVILVSLDQSFGLNGLLCLNCIKELETVIQSMNFQQAKQQVQEEQDLLYTNFCQVIKEIIIKIHNFKESFQELKISINEKLDKLLENAECWIKNLFQLQDEQISYSLLEELENPKESSNIKDTKRFQLIQQCNYSYFKNVGKFFQGNILYKELLNCENIFKEIFSIDYFDKGSHQSGQIQPKIEENMIRSQQSQAREEDKHESYNKYPNKRSNIYNLNILKRIRKQKQSKSISIEISPESNQDNQQQQEKEYKQNTQKQGKEQQKMKLQNIKNLLDQLLINQHEQVHGLFYVLDKKLILDTNFKQSDSNQENNVKSSSERSIDQELLQINKTLSLKLKEMIATLYLTEKKIASELTKQDVQQQNFSAEDSDQDQKNSSKPSEDVDNDNKISIELVDDKVKQSENCYALAFNNNNSIMVAGCNNFIKVWKFENGKLEQYPILLTGHKDNVLCLVFSKKANWFFSGSEDSTIRCWQDQTNIGWLSSNSTICHSNQINCLVMNNNETELISCSDDKLIKVWQIGEKHKELTLKYKLEKHTDYVFSVILNESETALASCGFDKQIIIWRKDKKNKQWTYKYSLAKSKDDIGGRICFINDRMIAWQQDGEGYIHIFQQTSGPFQEKPKLKIKLKQVGRDGLILFPSVFNKKRRVLIQKHNMFVYIIRYTTEGKFYNKSEPIYCNSNENYGALTNDGQYLAIWNNQTLQIRVYKLNYE